MNEVLAISLHSMQGDMARVDQVGMNLANALTPGYKRGVTVQQAVGASFAAHLSNAAENAGESVAPAAPQFAADVRPGTLKSTAQSLDVALAGKGYFEVTTPQGPAYTRQGNFRIDGMGRLVTAQGFPVMGTAGEITLNFTNPVIGPTGAISSGTAAEAPPLGQLKVVDFDEKTGLERLGDGLHAAGSGMKLVPDDEVHVRQGFLENSNVSSSYEMITLIKAMRHFESMQKVAQGYDDMLGVAIRKLGETS